MKLLFSFPDKTINVALILNPIDMTFVQPSDAQLIQESTHLRVLVFSEHAVSQVQVQIDDREFISLSQSMPDAPLYTGIDYCTKKETKVSSKILLVKSSKNDFLTDITL